MTPGELVRSFAGLRAVVVGDLMLDEYLFGRASRISPEAPVMVVRHLDTKRVPGGAANVARNISAMGGSVSVIGVVGDDEAGRFLAETLSQGGAANLVVDATRQTTRKTRVLADHAHQVLRIDAEDDDPIPSEAETRLIDAIQAALSQADVMVLSDYLKGALTPTVAREAVARARAAGVPVVVNPKPRSLAQYEGASLISLNRAEATEAMGEARPLSEAAAAEAAQSLRDQCHADAVLVTLGDAGMVAAAHDVIRVHAPRVEVADPAGAGDTVIATVALGVARLGVSEPAVYEAAAQMSAAVVQHVGVAVPSPDDLIGIH